jgi:hypothetical protein
MLPDRRHPPSPTKRLVFDTDAKLGAIGDAGVLDQVNERSLTSRAAESPRES